MDKAFLRRIPDGGPHPITYLNKHFKTNKREKQNKDFWFLTPESSGKTENHTPIQTRIFKELQELKEKESKPERRQKIPN